VRLGVIRAVGVSLGIFGRFEGQSRWNLQGELKRHNDTTPRGGTLETLVKGLTLYSPVVTICTASLTFNNSTLCSLSVFMCFVWICEQTAIITLYSINW